MKYFNTYAFLLFVYINSSIVAFACFCPAEKPCANLASADVVFVGVATKTQLVVSENIFAPNAVSTSVISDKRLLTSFKVEKIFSGAIEKEVDVSGGGTTCDYEFKEGERYLVFAMRADNGKTLFTNYCLGTTSEKEAQKDGSISYLENSILKPNGGVLEGMVGIWNVGILSKVKITLESETRKFQTITNKKGVFSIKRIPQGEYILRVNSKLKFHFWYPARDELRRNEWKIEIKPSACYSAKLANFRNIK